jgi:uncharacterized protein YjiS (DUF1127 family)
MRKRRAEMTACSWRTWKMWRKRRRLGKCS